MELYSAIQKKMRLWILQEKLKGLENIIIVNEVTQAKEANIVSSLTYGS